MKDLAPHKALDLSGVWQLVDETGKYNLACTVPGDVVTALEQARQVPDPYWGCNEMALRWVSERDWTLSKEVDLTETAVDLILDRVDTVAEIRVNGVVVGRSKNAFRCNRFDVSHAAKVGPNKVDIRLISPVRAAYAAAEKVPYPVPYHAENCPIPYGNLLRKPQCDFGWDWNIALAPMGVLGEVALVPQGAVHRLGLCVEQSEQDGCHDVAIRVIADWEGGPRPYRVKLGDHEKSGTAQAGSDLMVRFQFENPDLWWPNGMGDQPRLDLVVELGDRVERRKIALRRIELVSDPDAIGRSFVLQVNGEPVFARGANWIPADALPGRSTEAKTRALLESAAAAHMNMIRVWGGGRYEPTAFYEACDALGLLVWQDAMFACQQYPSDSVFLAEVHHEVVEQVQRLQPYVALWCGDNELVGALGWFEESRKDRDRYLVAYDRLNRTIESAAKSVAPINWWPSSPSKGVLDFGDGWHDDTSGDMHFWSVWHEGRDFAHYHDVAPRFCSEFGFQSYPSMDVIRDFADPKDHNIAAPVLEAHQKNAGGNARIAETMFRYFRFPEGFENFVYLSQVQQGLAIKTAVSAWRSQKPRCMGTLYWQLNDTWPVASWSSLDYGGGWKLLHHMARDFYAPVSVFAVPTVTGVDLVAVNDTRSTDRIDLKVEAMACDGCCTPIATTTATVTPEGAKIVAQIPTEDLAADRFLVWTVRHSDGRAVTDHYAPRPYKAFDLLPPDLSLEQQESETGIALTLTADRPAFFAAIEPSRSGRLSWNGGLVRPEAPVHLTFTPDVPGPTSFGLRDLHSATHGHA